MIRSVQVLYVDSIHDINKQDNGRAKKQWTVVPIRCLPFYQKNWKISPGHNLMTWVYTWVRFLTYPIWKRVLSFFTYKLFLKSITTMWAILVVQKNHESYWLEKKKRIKFHFEKRLSLCCTVHIDFMLFIFSCFFIWRIVIIRV